MVQSLMADRFHLKFHNETKKESLYALVTDRAGPKIAASTGDERLFRTQYGSLVAKKGRVGTLADWLSRALGRVVIDKTGLKGEYDFKLEWTPEPSEGGPESIGLPPETPSPHPETSGPTIFTAAREQLGLRLVPQKGPVEIVVIDGVDKPTGN
jgi:uncharacterized protein (TIGR03435 family)